MFDPSKFTVTKARPLPIHLLIDTSGSMQGEKIDALNGAVAEMLRAFAGEERMETVIEVGVINFGGDQARVFLPPTRAVDIRWTPLSAEGYTPLGGALRLAKAQIEDKTVTPSNAYRPTVILISDGEPNDDWEQAMEDFTGQGRSAKCDRMAMAIGARADAQVLRRFIQGTRHSLFTAGDAAHLHKFFQKVTMSIRARTRSSNPNDVPDAPEFKLDDRMDGDTPDTCIW